MSAEARKRTPSSVHSRAYRRMRRRLREAREELGLTQKEAARRFGRGQSFVSKCESGERRIDPIELWRFAQIYGRPVTEFLPEP